MLTKRAAGWVVVAGLLGGCSGGGAGPVRSSTVPEPVRTFTAPGPVRSSVVPVASPSRVGVPADVPLSGSNARDGERPPVEPGVAGEHSAAGARAFAVFFVQTIDWGYATVSGAYMRHYYQPSCATCTALADSFDADRRAGDQYIGGRSTIVAVAPGVGGALVSQLVTVNTTSWEKVTSAGSYLDADQAYVHTKFALTLSWRGQWRIAIASVVV